MKRRPEGRLAAIVFAVSTLLTLGLVSTTIRGADEIEYFSHLRSYWFDRDLDFRNEYEWFVARNPDGLRSFRETFLERREPLTGRPINFAPVGSAVLWAPFYATADELVRRGLVRAERDGFSRPYAASVSYGSALLAIAGFGLIYRVLRRAFDVTEELALSTVVLLWFGTPALYYMTIAPAFSHAPMIFAGSLVLTAWLRARETGSLAGWILVGVAGGLAALVREQAALFLVMPGLDLLLRVARERAARPVAHAFAMAASAAAAFVPQLLAYKAVNGTYGPTTLVTRKMDYASPHAFDVLFDPGHGLFLWTPALVVIAWGFPILGRRAGTSGALVALAFLAQVWVNGAVLSWHQAGAFGSRRFVDATPFLALGVAFGLVTFTPALRHAVVTLAICWNLSLMMQFGLRMMDRQRLDWPGVLVRSVTDVPARVFETARLYFTDREALVRRARPQD